MTPARLSIGGFLRLAAPLIVSRAGLSTMSMADGVMVAWHSAGELADLSLAIGTQERLLGVLAVFPLSGLALAPRFFARGDLEGARDVWLRSAWIGLLLGAACLLCGVFGEQLLLLFGQSPQAAAGAAPLMLGFALGAPPAMLAISAAVYLEGVGRQRDVALCVFAANVGNLALDWALIFGRFGLPALGASGSVTATSLVRVALAVVLCVMAWRRPRGEMRACDMKERDEARSLQWRMGASAAATAAASAPLSASMTLMAGRLGPGPLAAFAGTWNLLDPFLLIVGGLADAAGIVVAAEAGRAGAGAALAKIRSALAITSGVALAITAAFVVLPQDIADLLTGDPELRAAIAVLLPAAALLILVNAAGNVLSASARALRDAVAPALVDFVSLLAMALLAAVLVLQSGYSVMGLFIASLASAILRATLLFFRIRQLMTPAAPSSIVRTRHAD